MQLKISFAYIIAFLLLLLVMMELHEIVHISVGRVICGCWGERDFNVWGLCETCAHVSSGWIATLAGPVFSFSMMWLGAFALSSESILRRSLGFACIFANIPFGRITTAMLGGGDEMVVTRHFMGNDYSRTSMIVVCTTLLLLAGVPPVVKAYYALTNKRSWIYILGFLTLPLVFLLTYLLTFMNTLLNNGFLAQPWIMGTPLVITLHTGVAAGLLALTHKKLSAVRID